jgi:non-ribosomal peptide synthetase component F
MQSPDEYSPEWISAALALRTLRLFDNKAAALRAPRTATAQVRMLSNAVTSYSARARSASVAPFDLSDSMHCRFEEQAARHPQEIAVVCGIQKLAYGELNIRANRLARYLRRVTASPATLVGIFMEPCIGTVVCLLAALKAGIPYIPLNPDTAAAQTAGILSETEALILLPSESTPACLPARRARAISVESEIESIECGSGSNFPRNERSEGPGRAAFHAFSAGRKGPAFSHRACMDAIDSLRGDLELTPADWFVATMQPDLALCGIWILAPLIYGTRLILAPSHEDEISDFPFDQIERSRAVILQATTPIAAALLSGKWQVRSKLKLVCGADPWPGEFLARLDEMGIEVWQLQGSTASYQVSRSQPAREGWGSGAAEHARNGK